jgi:hypothetical protein
MRTGAAKGAPPCGEWRGAGRRGSQFRDGRSRAGSRSDSTRMIACRYWLPLTVLEIFVGVVVFMIGEILLSLVLYRFGIRDRPY